MQNGEPFTKKEMERAVADLPTYKLATLLTLKVSSSKLAGRRLIKLLLK
jgi:hypothetical protein